MHDTLVTLQGNLGGDVRLHETAESPVANFRVGSTPRWVDRQTGEWVDGTTVWYSVTAWRGLARNCADSLRRGDPVVVHGRLTTRTYVNNNGVEVSDLEVTATLRRPRPHPRAGARSRKVPPRQQPSGRSRGARRARGGGGRRGGVSVERYFSTLSRAVRTVRKASSSASTGATISSAETSCTASRSLPVGRARAVAGGEVDQDAGTAARAGVPTHDAADQQQDRQVDAPIGGHRVVAPASPDAPSARVQAPPTSAARMSSHWSTRTTPAHPGSGPRRGRWRRSRRRAGRRAGRCARPRPAAPPRPTGGSSRPRRRRRARAPRCRPWRAAPAIASGIEVRGAAGELAALGAEVEVQPTQRVRLEPPEPGDDRPAGGLARPASGSSARWRRPRSARRRSRPAPPPSPGPGRRRASAACRCRSPCGAARRRRAGRPRAAAWWTACPRPGARSRRAARRSRRRGGRWSRSPGPRRARPASSSRRTSSTIAARRSAGTVSMWLSTTTITPAWLARGAR